MSRNELQTTPDQVLPPWVTKMREAAMNAISETDITDIVKAMVERAKKGDANAIKFVFDQVLGGTALKGATFVQNNYAASSTERPDRPTEAEPGSDAKIELMRRRIESGNGAFVEGDELRRSQRRNGSHHRAGAVD